jgi:Uma2 family endonuclease
MAARILRRDLRARVYPCFVASHTRRLHKYTYDAYLEHEASSNVKHEFLDGEIYAMAGGTIAHALLAAKVITALSSQLRDRPCLVASSDLKVRVAATGLVTYPDVTVVCGPIVQDPQSRDVVLNPTVIVEVLSDSTEDWDRGEKLTHFQQIATLKACVLVSHRQKLIEVIARTADGAWTSRSAAAGQVATLDDPAVTLDVNDVYSNITLIGDRP